MPTRAILCPSETPRAVSRADPNGTGRVGTSPEPELEMCNDVTSTPKRSTASRYVPVIQDKKPAMATQDRRHQNTSVPSTDAHQTPPEHCTWSHSGLRSPNTQGLRGDKAPQLAPRLGRVLQDETCKKPTRCLGRYI